MQFQTNKPLSELTTLEIGGKAKEFVSVKTQEELIEVIKYAKEKDLSFLVIGGGSNLLVSDSGFDGLVIKNEIRGVTRRGSEEDEQRHLHAQLAGRSSPSVDKRRVTRPSMKVSSDPAELLVQAGTQLQELVDYTISNSLAGLNKLIGIPGQVGGAVFGNAGAFGQTISDCITSVIAFNGSEKITLSKTDCKFEYRDSIFKKNSFSILEVEFSLPFQDRKVLKKEAEEVLEKRLKKYPPGILCPGSFFKNLILNKLPKSLQKQIPKDRDFFGKVPAWYFLDEVGAKGDQIGQIKVASFHGNLFINLGGGKAEDFYTLAKKYYDLVKEKFGIELEPEVQLINLPSF